MDTSSKSVDAYRARAARYDQYASVTMGDRKRQRRFLDDLLDRQRFTRDVFLDLGCGTGFFSEVIFQHRPALRGHLVDGSPEMLELARHRLTADGRTVSYHHSLFDGFDWSVEPAFDLVFSAYAIHRVADADKWKLFATIRSHLGPDGSFILFDNFLPRETAARETIEYLTCMDIKRRSHAYLTPIEDVIANDRKVKESEGDQEANFEENLQQLRAAGFREVTPVFLEARYGGIVASKP